MTHSLIELLILRHRNKGSEVIGQVLLGIDIRWRLSDKWSYQRHAYKNNTCNGVREAGLTRGRRKKQDRLWLRWLSEKSQLEAKRSDLSSIVSASHWKQDIPKEKLRQLPLTDAYFWGISGL